MALILVEHEAAAPALYGALAAVVAAARGADLAHLPARFDTALHADAVQHVAASGVLVPSGLLWFERLTGREVKAATTVAAVLRDAARADVVVPLHPAVTAMAEAAALEGGAAAGGVAVERLAVSEAAGVFTLHRLGAGGLRGSVGRWTRDRFGRLIPASATALAGRGPRLRIGLVGAERDHRDVYPGALAALGDSADAMGLPVDVLFIDPRAVRAGEVPGLLAGVDGVLLPGGSDMANVPGQILMARGTLDGAVPAAGLCLGMQTMATALLQAALGRTGVNLAEADPESPLHSFVPMADEPSLAAHRLGEHPSRPVAGTRLGCLRGLPERERFNHRYRLNPALAHHFATAGGRVAAWDETGTVADAVEAGRHPFFIGLQGHPELRSRPDAPHPLLSAFVAACRRAADRGAPMDSDRGARCTDT